MIHLGVSLINLEVLLIHLGISLIDLEVSLNHLGVSLNDLGVLLNDLGVLLNDLGVLLRAFLTHFRGFWVLRGKDTSLRSGFFGFLKKWEKGGIWICEGFNSFRARCQVVTFYRMEGIESLKNRNRKGKNKTVISIFTYLFLFTQ